MNRLKNRKKHKNQTVIIVTGGVEKYNGRVVFCDTSILPAGTRMETDSWWFDRTFSFAYSRGSRPGSDSLDIKSTER
jgi:hypothetical protein